MPTPRGLDDRAASDDHQGSAALGGPLLHAAEAALELAVRRPQGILRIDLQMAREIRHREEHIAELFGDRIATGVRRARRLSGLGNYRVELRELLGELAAHAATVRPGPSIPLRGY